MPESLCSGTWHGTAASGKFLSALMANSFLINRTQWTDSSFFFNSLNFPHVQSLEWLMHCWPAVMQVELICTHSLTQANFHCVSSSGETSFSHDDHQVFQGILTGASGCELLLKLNPSWEKAARALVLLSWIEFAQCTALQNHFCSSV